MASCGLTALEKTQFIMAPKKIEEMRFVDILLALENYLRPKKKLTIAERTKFYSMAQMTHESVMDYVVRLRRGIEFCEFDKLKECDDPADEMLLVALVAGLKDPDVKDRALNKIQCSEAKLRVDEIASFVQQFEEIRSFVANGARAAEPKRVVPDCIHFLKNSKSKIVKNCSYCGKNHEIRRCPAYGKTCRKCNKKNHFSSVCGSKDDSFQTHHMESTTGNITNDDNEDLFCVASSNEKIKTETVLINGSKTRMQVDTGASCSVISSAMWKQLGKPSLVKCIKILEAYDGHI